MCRLWAICGVSLALLAPPVSASTTISYSYDDQNRLLSAFRSDGPNVLYTYDVVGNITLQVTSNPDSDGDNLKDIEEIAYGTNPNMADSDLDGLTDFFEVNFDGSPEYDPYHPLNNPTGTDLNPNVVDTDGDGVSDNIEIMSSTNPLDPSSFPIVADGDLNNDGAVDIIDVLIAYRILLGDITASALQLQHGDVAPLVGGNPQPNGIFNLGDVLVIQRKALGQISF
jgi:YD repeat-containing protein